MSQLVVIAYSDEATAQQALGTLRELSTEHLISLDDAAYVTRDMSGKPKLHQTQSLTGLSAASGAFWGFLIGLLFFVPIFGLVLGAAGGALGGKFADIGIDDQFMKEVGEQIKPGTAAIFMLVRDATVDKVVPEMAKLGGRVIKTSLSSEQENRLREALDNPASAEAGV